MNKKYAVSQVPRAALAAGIFFKIFFQVLQRIWVWEDLEFISPTIFWKLGWLLAFFYPD
jgi:hypothetical protein